MKLMVAFKLLVAFFCVHLAASAPLRLLRIRNMTFLFVESPDGVKVEILYAPGKEMGSFPIGRVPIEPKSDDPALDDDPASKNDDPALNKDNPAPQNDDLALDNDDPASKNDDPVPKSDDLTLSNENLASHDDEEPFDPELDAPRVESSVIQAPKFKSPCDRGHRVDRHGNCRRIW